MIEPAPPAELAFLTEAIGAPATLALIEARRGTRVYVPSRIDPDCPLARIIGLDAALALAAHFGGCYIEVPSAKFWRAQVYHRRGMSIPDIAHALGLNRRTAMRYLAGTLGRRRSGGQAPRVRGAAAAPVQMDLNV